MGGGNNSLTVEDSDGGTFSVTPLFSDSQCANQVNFFCSDPAGPANSAAWSMGDNSNPCPYQGTLTVRGYPCSWGSAAACAKSYLDTAIQTPADCTQASNWYLIKGEYQCNSSEQAALMTCSGSLVVLNTMNTYAHYESLSLSRKNCANVFLQFTY